MPNSFPVLALLGVLPASLTAIVEIPGPLLQLGLGGGCLWILYSVLSAQSRRQAKADERKAEADERMAKALESVVTTQATNTEIQRAILKKVEDNDRTTGILSSAVNDLVNDFGERHPKPHRGAAATE